MKRFFWTVLTASAALWLGASAAFADPPLHVELQKFQKAGGKVMYLGRSTGLDGWVLMKGKEQRYAYTTEEGGLVMGMLLDAEGKLVTDDQVNKLRPGMNSKSFEDRLTETQAPPPAAQEATPPAQKSEQKPAQTPASKVERLYAALESANWAAAGDAQAPALYMFMNTSCDHCQEFWKELQGAIDARQVQVRLLPFGKQDLNRDGGAALLSSADPAAAWTAFISGDKDILAKNKIAPGALEKMDANNQLIEEWKIHGTPPYLFYRSGKDDSVVAVIGRPKNTLAVLADLTQKREE